MENGLLVKNTIAAVCTPPGVGGVAIVRISGEDAFCVADKLLKECGGAEFCSKNKKQARLGRAVFHYNGVRDDVMAAVFYEPHSYTGENTVEIHMHGSPYLAERAVKACIEAGAHEAQPGEYTARAVLNGKMDLTQAEGVMDIISAQSEGAAAAAYEQLCGKIRRQSEEIFNILAETAAKGEVSLDYPDDYGEQQDLTNGIKRALERIKKMTDGYDSDRLVRSGVKTVIVGKANAGKSSLMNALLGRERAIVTDMEGTTRDTVEDSFEYDGIRFILCDTAGLRQADNIAEQMGIDRTRQAVLGADIVIVADGGAGYDDSIAKNKRTLRLRTKSDLGGGEKEKYDLFVSSATGEGIEQLKRLLADTVRSGSAGGGVNNARQYAAAMQAAEELNDALCAEDAPADIILSFVRRAMQHIGSITGKNASDEIITQIFSRFCVGK